MWACREGVWRLWSCGALSFKLQVRVLDEVVEIWGVSCVQLWGIGAIIAGKIDGIGSKLGGFIDIPNVSGLVG